MHLTLIRELIKEVAGKNTEPIAEILKEEKPVNEFKIAEKIKLTINQTRNILYKLYNNGIANFSRKKDKRKGWYIYFWTLNIQKSLEKLVELKKKQIENDEHQIKSYETKRFFLCPSDCAKFNEESALLHNFICPECGNVLQLEEKAPKIKEFTDKKEKALKELALIESELAKIVTVKTKKLEISRKRKAKAKKEKKKKEAKKLVKHLAKIASKANRAKKARKARRMLKKAKKPKKMKQKKAKKKGKKSHAKKKK